VIESHGNPGGHLANRFNPRKLISIDFDSNTVLFVSICDTLSLSTTEGDKRDPFIII
jgi:hypothetical protein